MLHQGWPRTATLMTPPSSATSSTWSTGGSHSMPSTSGGTWSRGRGGILDSVVAQSPHHIHPANVQVSAAGATSPSHPAQVPTLPVLFGYGVECRLQESDHKQQSGGEGAIGGARLGRLGGRMRAGNRIARPCACTTAPPLPRRPRP